MKKILTLILISTLLLPNFIAAENVRVVSPEMQQILNKPLTKKEKTINWVFAGIAIPIAITFIVAAFQTRKPI